MAQIAQTIYPQLKPNYSVHELQENFMPSRDEFSFMQGCTRDHLPQTQLCFMLLLKCYQCVGYPVLIHQIPKQVIQYIAKALQIKITIKKIDYPKSTRQRHIAHIRHYLQISPDEKKRRICLKKAALDAAQTKENLADIINTMVSFLIKERFEMPAYQSLLRLARAARAVTNNHYYQTLSQQLSPDHKLFIDGLFSMPPLPSDQTTTTWDRIKQDIKSPTTKNIQSFLHHLNWLIALNNNLELDLSFIPPAQLEKMVSEALALDAADLKKIRAERRYTLAVVLIRVKSTTAIDDLCSVLILWLRNLHTQGKEDLDAYRKAHMKETDDLIEEFYTLTVSLKECATDLERLAIMHKNITEPQDKIIQRCEKHLCYAHDNYYPFMLKHYKNKRALIFKIIDYLSIESGSSDPVLKEAFNFIKVHRNMKALWISPHYKDNEAREVELDLSWLSEKWFKMVTGQSSGSTINTLHRHYLEIATLQDIADSLDSGDAYVRNGSAFNDPNSQLMSLDEFERELSDYCQLNKLPSQPDHFVHHLQHEFQATAFHVDERYNENHLLSIENGLPILKKSKSNSTLDTQIKNLGDKIDERMPKITIIDVILDVDHWLHLSDQFKPLSGFDSKIEEHTQRFAVTSFSYGCNVGPTETERSFPKFSRKQIAWPFNHYLTERRLDQLSGNVINSYNQFELPLHWGSGKSVSVDGTYWDMYKKNLLAAHHIRYGDFGGIGYYHVSDKYIALYGNFISCGVHESNYLFDGLTENESDIQPDTVYGDTGAQTEVAFGFGYLLSIFLMPRIRNFKHLKYYKPSKSSVFKHIDELFCDQPINWELIQLHYHDMLRVVMSVRAGKIKPSVILRRLTSKSRKNKLYYAFRELGRVVRTKFLLNYIDDPELRRIIQAGTCKSEEFNEFISWVRFGDGGAVTDNLRFNQQKIIKYGYLVANMVILHVTANMTHVVNTLRKEGEPCPEEILAGFSPYRRKHISRLGIFPLDFDREIMALEYELIK